MSIFDRIFRRRPLVPPRDIAALTAPLAMPALRLRVGDGPARSHVGGVPGLPEGTRWPEHDGARLEFVARLSLAEIQAASPIPWLPDTGSLLFFYDVERQPWGFDPRDRGGWAVLHVSDQGEPAAPPDADSGAAPVSVPFRYIGFQPVRSLPSPERESVRLLGLSDAESEELVSMAEEPFQGAPRHQLAGYPSPIQGDDMELEAQLASHGLYCGNSTGYEDPRAAALRPGAKDWRLLLQLDSDDDLGVMWGDAGMLYFWVQESSARGGDFSNAWVVLQCG